MLELCAHGSVAPARLFYRGCGGSCVSGVPDGLSNFYRVGNAGFGMLGKSKQAKVYGDYPAAKRDTGESTTGRDGQTKI